MWAGVCVRSVYYSDIYYFSWGIKMREEEEVGEVMRVRGGKIYGVSYLLQSRYERLITSISSLILSRVTNCN